MGITKRTGDGTRLDDSRCGLSLAILLAVALPLLFGFGSSAAAQPAGASAPLAILAPFDSFVCFSASLNDCSKRMDGDAATFAFSDGQAGTVVQTAATPASGVAFTIPSYSCNYGKVTYQQKLAPAQAVPVAFYSPLLLAQLADGLSKLNLLRAGCTRLVQSYNKQIEILLEQEALAAAQLGTQIIGAQVDQQNMIVQNIGSQTLSDTDKQKYGMGGNPSSSWRDMLFGVRTHVAGSSDTIRGKIRDQTLQVDYANQFADAQTLINNQLQAIGHVLFLLDRSMPPVPAGTPAPAVIDGAWIPQGSTVATVASSGPHP